MTIDEDLSDADNLGYLRGYNEAIDDLRYKCYIE